MAGGYNVETVDPSKVWDIEPEAPAFVPDARLFTQDGLLRGVQDLGSNDFRSFQKELTKDSSGKIYIILSRNAFMRKNPSLQDLGMACLFIITKDDFFLVNEADQDEDRIRKAALPYKGARTLEMSKMVFSVIGRKIAAQIISGSKGGV